MILRSGDGDPVSDPDRHVIELALTELVPGSAVVLVEGDTYARATANAADGFDLEFRDGSPDRHYRVDYSSSLPTAVNVFRSLLEGDNFWRTDAEWHRVRGVEE
ncbi:hypothetical protein [Stackebrandtia soli]|uniref:hypothetical protein n=1 Tax=Stackebrandtia soli TaxID=1892856 RepID=UPI0039EA304C